MTTSFKISIWIVATFLTAFGIILQAHAATTLFPTGGGTGSTTLSGILLGNGTAPLRTLTVGSGLTLTGTTLSATGGSSASSTLLGDTNTWTGTENFTTNTGFGVAAPGQAVDILGKIRATNTLTDATNKAFYFLDRNYTNSQNDFLLVFGQSKTSANTLIFGGGQTGFTAASSIAFFTGAGNNTDIGTSRLSIDATGNIAIPILTGGYVASGPTGILYNVASSTIASSTLLADTNTWSGNNTFNNSVGIGSTSPFAKLSVHANNGDTATTLFAIGSSTQTATSTLFSISNTGLTTIVASSSYAALNVVNLNASAGSSPYAIFSRAAGNSTASADFVIGSFGITQIRTATAGSSLNVSTGSATVTGFGLSGVAGQTANLMNVTNVLAQSFFTVNANGNVGVGTSTPYAQFAILAASTTGATAPTTLFAIASTTGGTATSTLFSISNTGVINQSTAAGGLVAAFGNTTLTNQYLSIRPGGTGAAYFGLVTTAFGGDNGFVEMQSGAGPKGIGFATGSDVFGATPQMYLSGAGNLGIGTTTPWRTLSVGSSNVGTFGISTSTAGCAQFSALGELYSTGSTCGSGSSFSYPFPAGATSSPLMLLASTTIGNGTPQGGLTISGGATTTGNATILGQLTIGTTTGANLGTQLFLYNTNTAGASPSMVLGGNNGGDTDFWIGRQNNNDTANNDSLQIGKGVIPGTTPFAAFSYEGHLGLASTSPFATLSIHANPNDLSISRTLFAIGSSTASATTTLFSVSNTGAITTQLGNALVLSGGANAALAAYGGAGACSANNWVTTISAVGGTTCGTIGSNGLTLSMFPTIAANTVIGNLTGGTATPTAFATSSLFAGITGQLGYFSGSGTLIGTSDIFDSSAKIGIGSTTPFSRLSIGTGAASSSVTVAEYKYGFNTNESTTTAKTLDCNASNQLAYPLGGSATTFTLSNMTPGKKCIVVVQNPSFVAGALTWAVPTGFVLHWTGTTAPTQTTGANAIDVWSFLATQGSSSIQIIGAMTPW